MRRSAPFALVFATAVAFSIVAAGCGSSSATQGAPGASGATGTPGGGGLVSLPAVGGGSCKVTISGGLNSSWESKQDASSLLVSYWLSPASRALLGGAGESFLMNCQGTDGAISLMTTTGTTAAQFPEAAGSYVINAHGTASTPGTVSAVMVPKGDNLWRITEPGTFNVTALNASRFAGNFQIKIAELGPDLKLTGTTATVSGTFDLACTTGSCK